MAPCCPFTTYASPFAANGPKKVIWPTLVNPYLQKKIITVVEIWLQLTKIKIPFATRALFTAHKYANDCYFVFRHCLHNIS